MFGGTIDVFRDLLNFGIKVHYVSYLSEETIAPLLNENTKAVFGEVISNPGLDVIDVSAVAAFVHTHQIPLILDSTTATPLLIRPLKLGADVVVHSSSKYINGSGNSIGGVIVDGGSKTLPGADRVQKVWSGSIYRTVEKRYVTKFWLLYGSDECLSEYRRSGDHGTSGTERV